MVKVKSEGIEDTLRFAESVSRRATQYEVTIDGDRYVVGDFSKRDGFKVSFLDDYLTDDLQQVALKEYGFDVLKKTLNAFGLDILQRRTGYFVTKGNGMIEIVGEIEVPLLGGQGVVYSKVEKED
jgi:hypothetical protein